MEGLLVQRDEWQDIVNNFDDKIQTVMVTDHADLVSATLCFFHDKQ